ncbi:MAG: hypothetical protein PGN25_03540 [Methylorubrum populi]
MIKRTGIAILLGLTGFALGTVLGRVTEKGGRPVAEAEPWPPALRHITQFPPPGKAAKETPRSGR